MDIRALTVWCMLMTFLVCALTRGNPAVYSYLNFYLKIVAYSQNNYLLVNLKP
jgi:hypothetical protein